MMINIMNKIINTPVFQELMCIPKFFLAYASLVDYKYREAVSKRILQIYEVDYKDASNFIYKYNNVKYDSNKSFYAIFTLYMRQFDKIEIRCYYRNITSLPSYPNLKILQCSGNELTTLPYYPNLQEICCNNNNFNNMLYYPNITHYTDGYLDVIMWLIHKNS